MEGLVNWLAGVFSGINSDVFIFILSMLPVLELRGGMVAATLLGVPYVRALIICIIGNVIPIPFILFFWRKVLVWMKKFKVTGRFANWTESKTLKKRKQVDKYGFWGLILFTGIPLPGTGAWTGSILASLLYIPVKRSSIAICIGVFLAAAIMSVITYFIPWLVSVF